MEQNNKGNETTIAPRFWVSLEQQENPQKFAEETGGEFKSTPIRDGSENDGLGRRDFMKIMGASAMMASLAGCTRRPVHKIVPYVTQPQEIIPGIPNYYASANPETGYGFIVKTREGRPIKIDGNADHPMNAGSISAREQASVHDLYDPDRLRAPLMSGAAAKWEAVNSKVQAAFHRGNVAILTSTVLSPSLQKQIDRSGAHHYTVDVFPMDDVLEGQQQSYGMRGFPRYRIDKADYIVTIDADFLDTWGSSTEYTRQFAERRRLTGGKISMNKLVAFESGVRLTGQNADERIPIHPADQLYIALALAHEVGKATGRGSDLSEFDAESVARHTGISAEILRSVARELIQHRGRSLVLAGGLAGKGQQALALQNVVNFINSALGNDGETVDGTASPSYQYKGSYDSLERLINAMKAGSVQTLVIRGLNPLYHFPKQLGFAEALSKVGNVVYVGSYMDETAAKAHIVAAESHAMEAWGDVNPAKDVYSIVQPTIRPLWETRSFLEMMLAWNGNETPAHDYVRANWKELHGKFGGGKDFESFWEDCLQVGVIESAAKRARAASGQARSYRAEALRSALSALRGVPSKGGDGEFTVVLADSIGIGDGSQANNALLQELPDPVSKNTWGNYLAVSPKDAQKHGWKDGDIVTIQNAAAKATLPLYRQPGLHEGVVMTYLGYGRNFNGRLGSGVGVSVVDFTTSQGGRPVFAVTGIKISKAGGREKIACTQGHHTLEGRGIVYDTSLEEYRKDPASGKEEAEKLTSLWDGYTYTGYRWGMVVDVNNCTGCSACVVACSVENNVPAVGKDQVQKNREMQWLRIDRYYSDAPENPEVMFQPMLCQHCENAPCETVCPVLATTHSSEGLNQMIYNRCVGTKYCENNCPYKVRRFNWFNNNGDMNEVLEHPKPLQYNPEVTLRSRGVMEKCTFCVQRIEAAKSDAKTEGRRVRDQDLKTACQEACPTNAIVFGDINNPESEVFKLSKTPRGFKTLEELNTRPSVTYLTKVRNRAPKPKDKEAAEHHSYS